MFSAKRPADPDMDISAIIAKAVAAQSAADLVRAESMAKSAAEAVVAPILDKLGMHESEIKRLASSHTSVVAAVQKNAAQNCILQKELQDHKDRIQMLEGHLTSASGSQLSQSDISSSIRPSLPHVVRLVSDTD